MPIAGLTGAGGEAAIFTGNRMARRTAIWTQGGNTFSRVTSQDTVAGVDGREYTSDQATILALARSLSRRFCRTDGLDH